MLGLHAATCTSLAYAREPAAGHARRRARIRRSPQVPIIEHADVRRMLLAQKAYVEGGLALCLYCARLVDDQHSPARPSRRGGKRGCCWRS